MYLSSNFGPSSSQYFNVEAQHPGFSECSAIEYVSRENPEDCFCITEKNGFPQHLWVRTEKVNTLYQKASKRK